MGIIEHLKADKELIEMRKKWQEKTNKPFPPFNTDEYHSIEDYKVKINKQLKAL